MELQTLTSRPVGSWGGYNLTLDLTVFTCVVLYKKLDMNLYPWHFLFQIDFN
ncbi:hypothetical protein VCRA2114E365_170001 [Vibrio crassostreae]|nr:hypothetical protein VCRA2115O371_140001 [Vibrio crassostreae]CAK1787430.1 hypothetical protein VCRA2113O199_160001 [Vibrio crassostreae]CAK1799388.1 hypothetical protein VCRA2114O369_160131 [Vibrio crassostreae]CAK1800109.1 hypothetical protein VCRA2113O357_170001 [Vibrio crassostreae]CAK1800325.1 hypothetical protein VCRA2113O362_160131 [Vibrio crassostreae]